MIHSRNTFKGMTARLRILALAMLVSVMFAGPVLAQGLMTSQTYNRLEQVHDFMEEEEYEEALDRLRRARDGAQNTHEEAVIAQLFGFVYINLERYEDALDEFKTAAEIEDNGLPEDRRLGVMQNVIQLHLQFEQYRDALEWVDRYLAVVEASEDKEEAPSQVHVMAAQSHMQLEEFREALPFISKAIELEDEPNEQYYRVKLGILFELEDFRDAAEHLEDMVSYWPDTMDYWFQLFQINWQLDREDTALSVLKLAYRKGLFDSEDHYVNLFRMYMMEGAPYDAGVVMEEGMDAGEVPRDQRRMEMLSRAWIQAQERDRAIAVLEELAELQGTGESYYLIAQIEQERGNWEAMRSAALEAYDRGELDEPGNALLMAGRGAAESKDYDAAMATFQRAMEYERVQNQASSWVEFVQEEQALREQN
ncbi:tetratricopeptide (TPR) repeat protein [Natronospira proteinivora]|uniref:Tetratricopeptide (TPR) repeat protein n=1 Tax=Natronospira proteinivora TaxID=1807133 RepID=A0ABT1G4C3_9GAMM|nr:tetratricopeptide repeat protein [Natronospira proteinivora]MCP1726144.1 tetratricopeptide (TPR) repeat protein [Natronospira proteinivora]